MLEIENCYKILQADSKCTDLELRRKFRKRALESHPDKNIQNSQQQFVRVNKAYKRIQSYRRQLLNQKHQVIDIQSLSKKLTLIIDKWDSISDQDKHETSIGELNTIYQQHFQILESLNQRLIQMRSKN